VEDVDQATQEDLDLLLDIVVEVLEQREAAVDGGGVEEDVAELAGAVVLVDDLVVVELSVFVEAPGVGNELGGALAEFEELVEDGEREAGSA
jgi:hypothetical protein